MNLFATIIDPESVAHAVFILATVSALGLFIGHYKIKGVSLGIAGVLFSGLLFGHFGITLNDHVLEFVREFGLILFVYAIGLQVGPGFFSSLKKAGLPLNIMAVSIVLLGVGVAMTAHFFGGLSVPTVVGLLSGATTNTPSLGAAQQALRDVVGVESGLVKLPGLGYAVAYPFGVMGIILVMLLVKIIFRVQPEKELEEFTQTEKQNSPTLHEITLEVTNPNLTGVPIGKIPGAPLTALVISRVMHNGRVRVATPEFVLSLGDVLLAVGTQEKCEELRIIVGKVSGHDLKRKDSGLVISRAIATHKDVLGRTIKDLDFTHRYGVTVTRVTRMGLEFSAATDFPLQLGDTILLIGEPEGLLKATQELGNSAKKLDDPHLIAMLVGIALGVTVGVVPLTIPGLPAPVRLGLAGGPLIVAILLARLGRCGSLVFSMPTSANAMIREMGISLFLACVGVRSGGQFMETLTSGNGVPWLLWGAAITLIPLLIVGFAGRLIYKTNYTALCGVLAGAMTDPPALAFANSAVGSEAPGLAYATVYPITMLLRVLSTQAIVLFLL